MPLKDLGLRLKKSLKHPKANPEKRSAFCQKIGQHKEENRPIVFMDESGFAHDMPRTHGYTLKGKRCFGTHDWGAKGRTNVIGALLGKTLLTVSLFNSSINTLVFDAWVIQDLIPRLPKESVVVMDNASFHHGMNMKQALESAGHTLLYLPPYSPDLNPIEKKWAQAKAIRRKNKCSIETLFKDHQV